MRPPSLQKKKVKVSKAWWCVTVVRAARKVEAEGLLEPGGLRLYRTLIMPLHSGLGDRKKKISIKEKRAQKTIYCITSGLEEFIQFSYFIALPRILFSTDNSEFCFVSVVFLL